MKTKYKARRISHAGKTFASRAESSLYDLLNLWQESGTIKDLQEQPQITLTRAKIRMIPDFKYVDSVTNELQYAEFKGFETDVWRIKRRLWEHYGPAPLHVWKGPHSKIYLHETIIPKGETK